MAYSITSDSIVQRNLQFGMDHKVKLRTPLHNHYVERNPSSAELNEKHTVMELMLNMQISHPVTAVHMTVQECI